MTPLEQLALEAPPIVLLDPLAEFLGLRGRGQPITFTLEDAGRYAGHLCPTVATAFEMTRAALKVLYPNEKPVRGDVRVTVASAPDAFANGPLGRVIGYLTGAARDDGFGGLAGRWSRRNLLRFDPESRPFGSVLFERIDTEASVRLLARPERLSQGADISKLMKVALQHAPEPNAALQQAWYERVKAAMAAGQNLFDSV
jgi:hypothetical protein